MKSNAVIFTDANKVEFGEVETFDPGPNDVVVVTKKSQISNGTEGSFLRCERADGITPWQPGMPKPFPLVPGYQKVGIVESVGSQVKGIHEGQWVFCTVTRCKNLYSEWAGHVSRGPTPFWEVYPLPSGDEPEKYAGSLLTQVGYNGASRPPIKENCHALVMGDGLVGQWAAQTLQMRGANVAMVGLLDARLAMFEKRKGDITLNARDLQWMDKAKEWAGGGLDIVDDTVGNRTNLDTNELLIGLMNRDGHFIATGDSGPRNMMDIHPLIRKEITLHCPCSSSRPRLETVIRLINDGQLNTLPLITDRFKAQDAALAWDKIRNHPESTLGVILDWD